MISKATLLWILLLLPAALNADWVDKLAAAIEGYDKAHWVLIDYGEVIVHVFYESARDVYDLEALWASTRRVDISRELSIPDKDVAAA